MSLLKTYQICRRLMAQASWPPEVVREIQLKKLKLVVAESYRNIPFYKRILDETGISHEHIKTLDDLYKLPILTKSHLQSVETSSLTNQRIGSFKTEQSSGSTGTPFTVYYDRKYVSLRNGRFLRGLKSAGYWIGQKLFLITDTSRGKPAVKWLKWRYGSILDPPELLLSQIEKFRPDVLYGCTTPIRHLAEYIRTRNGVSINVKVIITTAEMLDNATRELLSETFDAEVLDFYGMIEMGLVGWECPFHSGYHLAEDCVLVEFLPIEDEASSCRLIMTNLDLLSMPLIRYDTGDIGVVPHRSSCGCGSTLKQLRRIEGRVVDCLTLEDGRKISPYQITCNLEKIRGLSRYQVRQEDYDRVTIIAWTIKNNARGLEEEIKRVMGVILEQKVMISVKIEKKLEEARGRKFRVVESRIS